MGKQKKTKVKVKSKAKALKQFKGDPGPTLENRCTLIKSLCISKTKLEMRKNPGLN